MMPLAFIKISVSHLTLSMSLCPSFKIALASRMTLRMSKCRSHPNLPSLCFTSAILVVLPLWMPLHSGQAVVLGLSSTPLIVSSRLFCCSMTRPFDGPMQTRSEKHQTGWRACPVMPGDPGFAWLMAHSFLLHLHLDTLGSSSSIVSPIIPLVLWYVPIFMHGSPELILLQLITLPNLRIIDYVLGPPGSVHDSTAFKESGQLFCDGEWLWADSAYTLLLWCMVPYKRPQSLVPYNCQFNYHLSTVHHV